MVAGYAELVKRVAAVMMWSLREGVGVSSAATAEWVRTNRPIQNTLPHRWTNSPAPWVRPAAAVAAARNEVATDATAREAAALEQLTESDDTRTELTNQLERVIAERSASRENRLSCARLRDS